MNPAPSVAAATTSVDTPTALLSASDVDTRNADQLIRGLRVLAQSPRTTTRDKLAPTYLAIVRRLLDTGRNNTLARVRSVYSQLLVEDYVGDLIPLTGC